MTRPTLTDVKGIGPAAAQKLQGEGITVAKLAAMTPQQLATVPGIGLISAKSMIASAKALVDGAAVKPVGKSGANPEVKSGAKKSKAKKAAQKSAKKSGKKKAAKASDKKAGKKSAKKSAKKSGKKAASKKSKSKKKPKKKKSSGKP